MIKLIGFDPASGSIIIQDNGVFLAGSLVAYQSPTWPDRIQIDSIAGRGEQTVVWSDIRRLDPNDPWAPADMAEALGYLRGEFAKRLPTGTPERSYALPAAEGYPVYPLNPEPADVNTVALLVNGVAYYPPETSVSSLSVAWQGPFPLDRTDAVRVVYF